MTKNLFKIALLISSFLGSILAIEVGIRLIDGVRGKPPQARAHWYWGFEQDRFLGYRPAANIKLQLDSTHSFDTNSAGFRDREIAIHSPTPRRLIICMGESSTWGIGSRNFETTWPKYLEKLLQSEDKNFVVLNAGVPAYTTVENLQLLSLRLLKYRPEAILYMGFRNDLVSYVNRLNNAIDLDFYSRPVAQLARDRFTDFWMQSAAVSYFISRFRNHGQLDKRAWDIAHEINRMNPQVTALELGRGKQLLDDNIALMSLLAKRHHSQFIWVDQVTQFIEGFDEFRKDLLTQVQQLNIPVIQAHSIYDQVKFPLLDDVHFSEKGNRYLAELIAPQLMEKLRSRSSLTASNRNRPTDATAVTELHQVSVDR